jgi:hypothetical protein
MISSFKAKGNNMGMEHTLPSYARVEHQAGTLRDEFAMAVDGLDAEVNDQYADRFNADKKPPKDDLHAWVKWFAKADANLRYIRADAMLEARKTTKGED